MFKPMTMTALAAGLALAMSASAPSAIAQGNGPNSHGKMNLSGLAQDRDTSEFIIGFANNGKARNDINAIAAERGVGLSIKRQLATGAQLLETSRALNPRAAEALMQAFARRGNVEYIEPNAMMQAHFTPNDEFYNGPQWHYYEPAGGLDLPNAWDVTTGAGAIVAVLDTGITDHSDLNANMSGGYDFVSDATAARDGNGRDSDPSDEGDWYSRGECGFGSPGADSSWHGTHVSGTVAAVTNNTQGVAGVAFDATVQPVRVLAKCGGTLADIADAIVWSSGGSVGGVPNNPNPADVINMSLGGSGSCGSTYQNAINFAVNQGTTVVVSAGNSNADASGFRPASCNNVISVAATDKSGGKASYSNYGSVVDVAAPGGDFNADGVAIASTLNDGTTTPGNENYVYYQGTSMSAPHVSGLAALMYSVDPSLTPAEVEQLIVTNARPFPATCNQCGSGIADADDTIAALGSEPPANQAPTADFSSSCTDLSCDFTDASSDSDGSIASYSWDFGDGNGSSAANPSHSYGSAGTYTVTLTVTDDDGASDSSSQSVTVEEPNTGGNPPAAPSNLSADVVQQGRGRNKTIVSVDLTWSDNSNNEDQFVIERCIETGKGRNKQCNFSTYATVGANVNSFSDSDPQDNAKYRVKATNANGDSGYTNEVKI